MNSQLVSTGPLQTALAIAIEAGDIHKLKDVAAIATALKEGARARGMGLEAENEAAEIVLRAERAIGQTLIRMGEDGTRLTRDTIGTNKRVDETGERLPTLADLGVRPQDAHKYQALARVSATEFEALVHDRKGKAERLARIDFLRLLQNASKPPAEAVRAVRELFVDGDAPLPLFEAFAAAAEALVISELPEEEFIRLAGIIRTLLDGYNTERQKRAA